jgi:dTDP-4-amino-4,6-dideoxygalactose transaminase
MRQALDAMHLSGDGAFTRRSSHQIEELLGVERALLTTSCTHALEMAALLLDIEPGDEVIVPAFTFVSTPNAFVLRGARPVFADIREDTLNIDERQAASLVTPRTRALAAVHYAGVACEMDALTALAGRHGFDVVEDNAHGFFGMYRGKPLGTFGRFGTLSFHETKNLTCGEGGALLVTRASDIERAEIVREKGTNRSRFFRGEIDRYTWVDVGSSYLPSDLLAALLLAQLERRDWIQQQRQRVWETYAEGLGAWAARVGARLPYVPDECAHPYHMFYLVLPTADARDHLLAHLTSELINAVFHYLPLNVSEMGRRFGGRPGQCPVTESISARLLRLPFYVTLSADDQGRIIDAVQHSGL